ncbi:type VI secretion system-associated protein TagO [Salmonella enterica]|uniref:Type VI secretion system-associated protein TagO n=1 Tax=Salmonella enterica subsp. enterica serovar Kintambo TaxID=1192730 RepID=A0A5W7RWH4_SALET|nr:type VI secretion system-associated protein TagO [Salmonella enterica subsp. enterica serovar Kintambo]EBZ5774434.1 type VI secretion system-associated protein TagO [Salmonella enterica subsp. enterica serovar Redlands]ECE6154464.1 type VI secretion system-associated protein TagO [Salmonella enterica subsp. enterica]ELX7028089.1 type VI secretion system-associated protein TagO [Salmonella enterica]MLP09044.1 type VI secretion system-associated protein TagO [Salmonella enterica subsp. enteric
MNLRFAASLWGLTLFSTVTLAQENVPVPDNGDELVQAMQTCRAEPAALVRLDCYDRLLPPDRPDISGALVKATSPGNAWQRAIEQEKQRTEHDTAFLVTKSEGESAAVIITTPALGSMPPRPVLMFSCVDNITRMQIALPRPYKGNDIPITLRTDTGQFHTRWFIRESGYLLEASRGLAGIDEIKQLFGAKTLTINTGTDGATRQLTFTISGLTQTLEPLREACHWAGQERKGE